MNAPLREIEVGGEILPLFPVHYEGGFDPDSIAMATEHLKHSATLGLPELKVGSVKEGKCVFVGSAPSVKEHIETIRMLSYDYRNCIVAVNDSNDFLMANGIKPDANVIFEVAQDPAELKRRHYPGTTYYVHSMAHPTTFEALEGMKVVLWHTYTAIPEHLELMQAFENKHLMIGGGVASTLNKAIPLMIALGYRQFELFGVDSSYPENENTHFNGSPNADFWRKLDIVAEVNGETKIFKTLPYLAKQADEFRRFCQQHHWMLKIKVHGNGLLPWMHRKMYPTMYQESEQ